MEVCKYRDLRNVGGVNRARRSSCNPECKGAKRRAEICHQLNGCELLDSQWGSGMAPGRNGSWIANSSAGVCEEGPDAAIVVSRRCGV